MKKTISQKTTDRLMETPEGQAMLGLLQTYGSPTNLARKLGVDPQAVRQWVYAGAMPKSAAMMFAKALGTQPFHLRPDLPTTAWVIKVKEEKVRKEPLARTADAKLLADLAIKYGSVKALCEAAGCSDSEFRTWKYRGRIPAVKLPTFLGLNQ